MSISSGLIGNAEVNCHLSLEVGSMGIARIIGQDFQNVSFKRKDKVISLASCTALKIGNKKIACINPLTLFHRLCVVKQSEEDLKHCFSFELAPYPTSLFTEEGLRKGTKSSLYEAFTPLQDVTPNIKSFVVDGGYFLHKVVWNRNDKFRSICQKYESYLRKHYGSNITVVFDGYPSDAEQRATKSAERFRRLKTYGTSADIIFNEETNVAVTQEKFLANENNKNRLICMLLQTLKQGGIEVQQATEDADGVIVDAAISLTAKYESVAVVSEDIDVLVLLTGIGNTYENLYFHKPGKGKKGGLWYSTTSFKFDPKHVLFIHAFTGCDTTSAFFGHGKTKFCTLIQNQPLLQEHAAKFSEPNASRDVIEQAGEQLILALYGQMTCETLDELRYGMFLKSTVKNAFNLARLPPTTDAAAFHSMRTYHQVQAWLGRVMNPLQWGWRKGPSSLLPITMMKDAAPEFLLKIVSCSCKKGCTAACSCRKSGLHCSTACKHCCGLYCENIHEMEVDDGDEACFDLVDDDAAEMVEENVQEEEEETAQPGPSKRRKT